MDVSTYLNNPLYADVGYEFKIHTKSIIGFSESSESLIERTEKKPSTASSLIKFYEEEYKPTPMKSHPKEPWECENGYKNWEMDKDTLFLGFKTFKSLTHKNNIPGASQLRSDEIAVLMVDVAPEFEPNIKASRNKEEMKVIMFVGETGAGKTTQINAFLSYLFDCDLSDQKRILVVDDRKCEDEEALSTTKYITIYRIRPFSDLFEGKTFYIIDTPGYGDTSGPERDKVITAAMNVMFNSLPTINTIVLTCKANTTKATAGMSAVITNIFQLFAKDVRTCLRTVLTFSDGAEPQAKKVLEELGWLEFCTQMIEVNNSAFRNSNADNRNDPKVRDWWNMSMSGQEQVCRNLSIMPAVPTKASAQVTYHRQRLQETCKLVQESVFKTANKTGIKSDTNSILHVYRNTYQISFLKTPCNITQSLYRQLIF